MAATPAIRAPKLRPKPADPAAPDREVILATGFVEREKQPGAAGSSSRSGFEHPPQQLDVLGESRCRAPSARPRALTACITVVWSRLPNFAADLGQRSGW